MSDGLDQRNFRSKLIEKVGCRNAVDQRKVLDCLLKEEPRQIEKIEEVCRRFVLPDAYREPVWTLLLELNTKFESDPFLVEEQKAISHRLERALHFMSLIDDHTPKYRKLSLMWLLEKGRLAFDTENQLQQPEVGMIVDIAKVFERMAVPFSNEYIIMSAFIAKLESYEYTLGELVLKCKKNLAHQDPQLLNHVNKVFGGSMDIGTLWQTWFRQSFAGILHENVVIRLWDKVIGGNYVKTMPMVALLLMAYHRQHILSKHKIQEIRTLLLKPLPLEASEQLYTQLMENCDTTKLR